MDSASAISLEKMENAVQKKINWVFPNDFLNATESANTGIPIQKLQPFATISKVFSSIAHEITELQPEAEQSESWFSKWLK
jgi:MinD-like ATPase involved in chromosome partitioning or flagellar assembly